MHDVPVHPNDVPVTFRGRSGTYTIPNGWTPARRGIMQMYYPMLEIAFLRKLEDEKMAQYAAQTIADELSFSLIIHERNQGWYRTEEVIDG